MEGRFRHLDFGRQAGVGMGAYCVKCHTQPHPELTIRQSLSRTLLLFGLTNQRSKMR